MDARERFLAILNFEPGVRPLFWEFGYWYAAVERWYREGLPKRYGVQRRLGSAVAVSGEAHIFPLEDRVRDRDVHEALGFDEGMYTLPVKCWIWPPFPEVVLEDRGEHKIVRDGMGVTKRVGLDVTSPPEWLDWPVHMMEDFEKLRAERLQPRLEGRVPSDWTETVAGLKDRTFPLAIGGNPCGFYGSLRYLMGEVNLLMGYYDKPDLIHHICSSLADFWIELWSQVLSQIGVDACYLWEDMCYRTGPVISPAMFRVFMVPYYQKLTRALRDMGVVHVHLDTDGNLRELIPLFLESGITGLYPMEAQAGMDVVEVRKNFPRLRILGGMNKMQIARGRAAIDAELDAKLPFMLERGGYIPFVDHHVPPDISWEDFVYYRARLREMCRGYA